jgi:hypothetical protein
VSLDPAGPRALPKVRALARIFPNGIPAPTLHAAISTLLPEGVNRERAAEIISRMIREGILLVRRGHYLMIKGFSR